MTIEWISVKERMPKRNKPVMVADSKGRMHVAGWTSGAFGENWMLYDNFLNEIITHWAELPEPPEREGK